MAEAKKPVTVYAARIRYGEILIFKGPAVLTEKIAKLQERHPIFGYAIQISRCDVSTSEREVMQRLVEQAETALKNAKDDLKQAEKNLVRAQALLVRAE